MDWTLSSHSDTVITITVGKMNIDWPPTFPPGLTAAAPHAMMIGLCSKRWNRKSSSLGKNQEADFKMLTIPVQMCLVQRRSSFQHECNHTCAQMLLRGKYQHACQPQGTSVTLDVCGEIFSRQKVSVVFETEYIYPLADFG